MDRQPTLKGESLLLRPLCPGDFDPLFAVAADPLIWEQHPEPTRYQRPVFERYFEEALASGGALLVTGIADGAVIGSSRYYGWDAAARSVVIGYTFLARSHWGGATNRELKHLMLQHAFRWVDVAWFHVGSRNMRSRRAMEKIGGRLDGGESREVNGAPRELVYYRIDAARWPPPATEA